MGAVKRSWPRRFARGIVVLVVLAAVLATAGKYWIVPALVRWGAAESLKDYWDGTIGIGEIDFNFTGPTYLHGVEIRDGAGRLWASVRSVKASLRDWPGLQPVLTDIEVEKLDVQAHFVDGRCEPPFRRPPPRPPSRYVDLQSVRVANASLTVVNGDVKAPGPAACEIHGTIRLDGNSARVDDLRGLACGGALRGGCYAAWGSGIHRYGGQVSLTNVNMTELLRALAAGAEMKAGDLTGNLVFLAEEPKIDAFRAQGQVNLEKADFAGIPVIKAVLGYVGLGDMDRFRVAGLFSIRGRVMTIEQARMANPFGAFDVQPGGRLYLRGEVQAPPGGKLSPEQTDQIDLHIVAALYSDIKGVLDRLSIPLLNPLAGLTGDLLQHFTRIQVKGRWSDPPEKLIRKDIAQDLQAGTLKFLTDAVQGGGQFGQGALKTFDELLKGLNGKSGRL